MNNNELKIAVSNYHQWEGIFKKVPASELRLDDDFMKHHPKTDAERKFKNLVKTAIKNGLRDFWSPVCDPSFDYNGHICYEFGKMPARGESEFWWKKSASDFCPERGSRLGTKYEYVAFLAVLIKQLVASGRSIKWAWNAVCNDSKKLGHYLNSKGSKRYYEPTGSREVCGWYDLANMKKILAEEGEEENRGYWRGDGHWLAGGHYAINGDVLPLAFLWPCNETIDDAYSACGWIILTEGDADN